jgi:hypothetical protein
MIMFLIQERVLFLKRVVNVTTDWNLNKTTITLPYSYESLIELLSCISKNKNHFSHYDFAQWCDNFTMVFEDDELSPIVENAVIVAQDIECQWDLFLVNSYSLKELQKIDLSKVKLPQEWFIQWLEQLKER